MFLHPQNALLISLSHSLIQLYGRAPGYQFNQMSADQLKRKASVKAQMILIVTIFKSAQSNQCKTFLDRIMQRCVTST